MTFWIGMTFMFAAGIFFPVKRYLDMKQSGSVNSIDNGFWSCALFIGIIMAVFCSLFIGKEYSDGTLRNKIITGQKRTSVYLANFVTSAIVSVVMCGIFFLPYLCIGIPLLGSFEMNIKTVLLFALTVLLLAMAFSSVFTLISMLNHNKAVTAVLCILLAFGFLLTGSLLNRMLNTPKTISIYTLDENNNPVHSEEPNPKYLEGLKREFVQTLYDINPGGQVIQCVSLEAVNLSRLPVYSLLIMAITTGAGLFFFKKKELK